MTTFLRNGITIISVLIAALGILLGMLLYMRAHPVRDLNNATLVSIKDWSETYDATISTTARQ